MAKNTSPNRVLRRYLTVMAALCVVVVGTVAGMVGCGVIDDTGDPDDSGSAGGVMPTDSTPSLPAEPTPDAEELAAQQQAALTEALDEYLADLDDLSVSVAIADSDSWLSYGRELKFDTASIVKVEIMTLWLRMREDADLPPAELDLAERMITESDNDATNQLYWDTVGGPDVLTAGHDELGMADTERGETWGATRTTAADQLACLQAALFPETGMLSDDAVTVARDLMGDVIGEQSWGVSAAAESGETVWLKNGWDTRTELGGKWLVNSIGVLGGDTADPVTIAVLTAGHDSHEAGVAVVEDVSRIARDAMADPDSATGESFG